MNKIIAATFISSVIVLLTTSTVSAQNPAHYYPARPVFSPYLFYGQFNGTGIPNYYTFVRPGQIYQEYASRRQTGNFDGDQRQRLISENQVEAIVDNQLRQRLSSGVGSTTLPAGFQDRSHFYPRPQAKRR